MDRLSEKIITDAKEESCKIIKKAEEDRRVRDEERRAKAKQITEQIEKETEEIEESEYERLVGLKEIEIRNRLLREKHSLMERLLKETENEIFFSPLYKKFILSLLENSVETGSEEVITAKDEKLIDQELINRLNKEKGWGLRLSDESVPIKGGFILVGDKVRIDASIETLFKEKRELLEPELVKILFVHQ